MRKDDKDGDNILAEHTDMYSNIHSHVQLQAVKWYIRLSMLCTCQQLHVRIYQEVRSMKLIFTVNLVCRI